MLWKKKLIFLLILIWAVVVATSYFMSVQIEGPRNIDTGFKRLEILARYQIIAFGVAVGSAIAGVIWRKESKRIMLFGFIPLLVTVLLVAALFAAATVLRDQPLPSNPDLAPKPTAPAQG